MGLISNRENECNLIFLFFRFGNKNKRGVELRHSTRTVSNIWLEIGKREKTEFILISVDLNVAFQQQQLQVLISIQRYISQVERLRNSILSFGSQRRALSRNSSKKKYLHSSLYLQT